MYSNEEKTIFIKKKMMLQEVQTCSIVGYHIKSHNNPKLKLTGLGNQCTI